MEELNRRLVNAAFPKLKSLTLVYRNAYVDTFTPIPGAVPCSVWIPVPKIERLHFRFAYCSFDAFQRVIPVVFPSVQVLSVDCEDKDFVAELKKRCPNVNTTANADNSKNVAEKEVEAISEGQ